MGSRVGGSIERILSTDDSRETDDRRSTADGPTAKLRPCPPSLLFLSSISSAGIYAHFHRRFRALKVHAPNSGATSAVNLEYSSCMVLEVMEVFSAVMTRIPRPGLG